MSKCGKCGCDNDAMLISHLDVAHKQLALAKRLIKNVRAFAHHTDGCICFLCNALRAYDLMRRK